MKYGYGYSLRLVMMTVNRDSSEGLDSTFRCARTPSISFFPCYTSRGETVCMIFHVSIVASHSDAVFPN